MRPYSPIRSRQVQLTAILAPLLLAGLWPSSPAFATNGVLEINRTCATQTGCFPGDTAGFPVTITGAAGRNYRLTSDLGVAGLNTTVIQIAADHTTIDLAGFRIICTTFIPPLTIQPCSTTGSGSGSGIAVDDPAGRPGVEVRNGSIFGMPNRGVDLGGQCVVRDLRVSEARGEGIRGEEDCIIEGNTVFDNGLEGISTGNGSTVSGNTVWSNGRIGIRTLNGAIVSGNTVRNNGSDGINTFSGSTVSDNTVSINGDDGIFAGNGSLVQRNNVSQNANRGLALSTTAAYRANVITGNGTAGVTASVNRGSNYCQGTGVISSFCP